VLLIIFPLAGPGVAGSPVQIRRAALVSCRRLLPRMHLAGYSSNILHPLLRVLDGGVDELRTDALDTICSLALALGPDFPIFAPTVRKVCGTQLLTLDNRCCWYGSMMCWILGLGLKVGMMGLWIWVDSLLSLRVLARLSASVG